MAVDVLADLVHPDHFERPEILAERLRLFPAGCLILKDEMGGTIGYGFAHPWFLGTPPALDTLLGVLPAEADCLHVHDVAIHPGHRGGALAGGYVTAIRTIAREHGFAKLSCVAVHGTDQLWKRYDAVKAETGDESTLASYGADALYMTAPS